ncbi:MAG: lysylphosphatidylglycerol synthase transmembrane domain-containing protein [Gammaproteobacteria bacterium]
MKRFLWPLLRVLITVALLWWIARDPAIRAQIAAMPTPPAPGWLLPAWLAGGVNELAGALRWWLCLRIAGVPLGFAHAAGLHFLGLFISLFLPGTAGGDAAKIAAVMFWHPERKIAAVLAMLMERLSGLFIVMIWTTVVAALRAEWFQRTPATAALFHTVLFFLGTTGLAMVAWYLINRPRRQLRHPPWFPFGRRISELAGVFDLFLAGRGQALAVLFLAGVCHAGNIGLYYFAARAQGMDWALTDALSLMPVIDVITMLPVTLSGLGLREAVFQALLVPLCAVAPATAVLVSLTGFFVGATWSLPGAGMFLWFRALAQKERADA